MSSPSVWVQLCYVGNKPKGQPVKIDPIPEDVHDLKGLVYGKKSKSLQHCDPDDLVVFPPGTTPPFLEDNALDPGVIVPNSTTSTNPLIVMAPAPQQQPENVASAPVQIDEQFYKNARLPRSLLEKFSLKDYIKAAEEQANSRCTKEFLDYLICLQNNSNTNDYDSNVFATIIASSGTGKTQLAATAALNYNKKATIVYLLFAAGEQRFYKPHMTESATIFKNQLSIFLHNRRGRVQGAKVTATSIMNWAIDLDKGDSVFVHSLYQLLVGEKSPEKCFLKNLKKKIEGQKFLVFLDEVPKQNKEDFFEVLCLRDTLRYLGIAPILMSTHTGAQNYVGQSSRDSGSTWVHIISKLPPYQPSPNAKEKLIFESERPLVLGIALTLSKTGGTVPEIVRNIRRRLQETKGYAWSENPALQLVQLFCTHIEIEKEVFTIAHSLVGHHFGCLQQREGNKFGAMPYFPSEAKTFSEILKVAPVSAQYEPLLYLALVTWDKNMLKDKPKEYFPLTNKHRQPITVREAYNLCSDVFQSKASYANQQAQKADGDLLEVLVHASLSLASMKTSTKEDKYLAGMSLKDYLPLVRRLMLPGNFDCIPHPPALFDALDVEWITIPALGGCDSGLPIELASATESLIGFLSRPKDQEKVDGYIYLMSKENGKLEMSDKPCISVECKNHSDGVDAVVLKQVFNRIAPNIKFCFVFVSSIKDNIFDRTSLDKLKEECFRGHSCDSISVLRWDKNKDKEPTFLSIGTKEFKATTEKTELLVVIIEVGLVGSKKWVQQRKTEEGSQAGANVPW